MTHEIHMRALLLLMYHNKLDTQRVLGEVNTARQLNITFNTAWVRRGKVYLFDYLVYDQPLRKDEIIEKVTIEEAVQVYKENQEMWNAKMRALWV